jgi:hypothetical protein
MIVPRKAVKGDCGAYIGAVPGRQAIKPQAAILDRIGFAGRSYRDFTMMNPV